MTKCFKCNAKIVRHLWIVDSNTYCSPFCERSEWDRKEHKWTTRSHKYGDSRLKRLGLAGLKKEKKW